MMNTAEAYGLLQAISNLTSKNEPVPSRLAYAMAANAKALMPVAAGFEKDRAALIKQFAVLDGDGNPTVKDGMYMLRDQETFDKEINALQNVEADVKIMTVSADTIGGTIEPAVMTLLFPMLEA